MRWSWFGPGIAVFLLFFALSLAEAFVQHDWLLTGVFFSLGAIFLAAMNLSPREIPAETSRSEDEYKPLIPTPLF